VRHSSKAFHLVPPCQAFNSPIICAANSHPCYSTGDPPTLIQHPKVLTKEQNTHPHFQQTLSLYRCFQQTLYSKLLNSPALIKRLFFNEEIHSNKYMLCSTVVFFKSSAAVGIYSTHVDFHRLKVGAGSTAQKSHQHICTLRKTRIRRCLNRAGEGGLGRRWFSC
jgi:hypothetical protein